MARLAILFVLIAAGLAGCGATKLVEGAPTKFKPPDGWFTVETHEPGGLHVPVAWASNVPFVDDPADRPFPDRTVEGLSADGIVVEAVGPWVYTGDETVPTVDFPLRVSDLYCDADGYEGQPAPNVSSCNLAARLRSGEIFNARVFFGRNEPTPEMTAQANDVLATLAVSPSASWTRAPNPAPPDALVTFRNTGAYKRAVARIATALVRSPGRLADQPHLNLSNPTVSPLALELRCTVSWAVIVEPSEPVRRRLKVE